MNQYRRLIEIFNPLKYECINYPYQIIRIKILTMKANKLERKLWKVKRFDDMGEKK